jgi:hypothetical protein
MEMDKNIFDNCVVFDNGIIIKTAKTANLWDGLFSVARTNGPIVHYIQNCLKGLAESGKNTLFVLPVSDGNIRKAQIEEYVQLAKTQNKTLIVGTLGQVVEDPGIHYFYMQLDDGFFKNGTAYYFKPFSSYEWTILNPKAYWRGGCSGGGLESVRSRTVKELLNYEYANVKFTRWGNWENGKQIPSEYFGERVDYKELLKYKIFLIIDGNVIASNHMWGFASGAVPFIISNAKCWFSPLLEPFGNYIPIKYDLSDLKENIEWVIENDDAAKMIAQNAVEFAERIFSSENQQQYIQAELLKLASR